MKRFPYSCSSSPIFRRQHGISMLMTLVALAILMVSAVALIRSFGASTMMAGSVAFKRNSINAAEKGFDYAIHQINGNLITDLNSDDVSHNYSSKMLATDNRGIPTALLSDTNFSTAGTTTNDIQGSTLNSQNQRIRYVIDRQCKYSGAGNASTCVTWTGSSSNSNLNPTNGSSTLQATRSGAASTGSTSSYASWPLRITVQVQDVNTHELTYLQAMYVPK